MTSRIALLSILAILGVASISLVPGASRAAEMREWVGLASGDRLWSNDANWSGGAGIADGDSLIFGDAGEAARLTNDLPVTSFQSIEFTVGPGGYILEGNGVLIAELTAGENSGTNEVALNIAGEAHTIVASGAKLVISGANSFTGDVDVAGEIEPRADSALGAATGGTNILPTGKMTLTGRDLGEEEIRISPHTPGQCAIVNSLTSVLRNVQVAGPNCIQNTGTLNFPDGINPFTGSFDLLLFGGLGSTFLVGGSSDASGPLRVSGETALVWNSSAPVDISYAPFEQFTQGGTLTGAGTARSLTFSGGLFKPGNGDDTGRFILDGALGLEDATLLMLLNGSTTGTGYSQVRAGGPIAIGPGTHLDIDLGFNPNAGQTFRIIDNTGIGSVVGTFQDLPEGATFTRSGRTFTITYKGGDGNDVEVTVTAAAPTDPRPFKVRLPMLSRD